MLDDFQKRVIKLIAANRSAESVAAGGAALNRARPRRSNDLDLFHAAVDDVKSCAERDIATLQRAGLKVETVPGFARGQIQAVVRGNAPGEFTRIDWAVESAFRFFPAVPDPEFGWRLHDADLAVNKMLALAGRQEPRDYVDVMDLNRRGYTIAALAWAAPAKDPGFTPLLILDEISRNSRIDPSRLAAEILSAETLDPVAMKRELLDGIRHARALYETLPPEQMGCLYVDEEMNVAAPDPAAVADRRLRLHRATLRGTWPTPGS